LGIPALREYTAAEVFMKGPKRHVMRDLDV